MKKVRIYPQWLIEGHDGDEQKLPQLIGLLTAIYEDGNLLSACRRAGMSYRYAWGIIKNSAQLFGAPLVNLTRGQGAKLTVLGEKLVWADKRINARLSPLLDNLACELDTEIRRATVDSKTTLRIHASHGYAVATLRDLLIQLGVPIEFKFSGRVDALASLCGSNCDLAGFHVPIGELQAEALAHYVKWLKPSAQKLIHVVNRRQGIMVSKGNPKQIFSLADLVRPGIRFINRQHGSGTRMLLELLLRRANISPNKITGYESSEFTHDAIAAYIASGMADAGLGVEAGARRFALDFIPIVTERYFLCCYDETLAMPSVQQAIDILRSINFKTLVNNLQGLDTAASGTIQTINEAFPDLPVTGKRRRPQEIIKRAGSARKSSGG